MTADPNRRSNSIPPAWVAVLPFLDPRAWGAIVYLWLAFPLGLIWFIGMTVGLLTGAALSIVWVGFLVLAATFAGIWGAEGLERRLAIALLGARVPERRQPPAPGAGWGAQIGSVVGGPAFWKGMLFLVLRFPLGFAGWLFSLLSLLIPTVFVVAPWAVIAGYGDLDFDLWIVDSPWSAFVLSALGFLMLVVAFHLHRLLGRFWAVLAEWLLGAEVPVAGAGNAGEKLEEPVGSPAQPVLPAV
jgi:hypothetical protein